MTDQERVLSRRLRNLGDTVDLAKAALRAEAPEMLWDRIATIRENVEQLEAEYADYLDSRMGTV